MQKAFNDPLRYRLGKKTWFLLQGTFNEFVADNAIKLSASLSYYTIFSLPPLLIIIISICGVFFGEEAVRGELFGQINGLMGNDAATEIQTMIANVKLSDSGTFATVAGIVILLIGASGVFAEIQSSINYIWGLEAKPRRGFVKFLKNRLMSFSMIGSVGFLLIAGLLVNTVMDILSTRLESFFPAVTVHAFYIINLAIVFLIITFLFTMIFRTLPDGKVSTKDAVIGAAFTALLFMIGKFAIGFYIGSSAIASAYGAAGSVILVLAWVYYSAIILYFGAEFTKVYAFNHGARIVPNEYSVQIRKPDSLIRPATPQAAADKKH